MTSLDLTQPAPITANQALANFDSGEFSLNEWLKKRAFKNHAVGASRCFVVCAGVDVIGYYSLSAGAISHEAAPKAMRRNMPDPLPVLLLGRLAVDCLLSQLDPARTPVPNQLIPCVLEPGMRIGPARTDLDVPPRP